MAKKVLLINGYFRQERSEIGKNVSSSHSPPLGIGYIGTYLRDHAGCTVELLDPVPQGLNVDTILRKVSGSDIVGISCYTDIRFQCLDLARMVKTHKPSCLVVVGGPHVYHLDQLFLEQSDYIDIIVRGEGEETMCEIVSDRPFPDISGITYKAGGKIARNPDRPFFQDIEALYIDYSLMPDVTLYGGDIEAPIDLKALRTAYLIESRGCAFKCSYCANDHWRRTWRATSAKKIVDKMEALVSDFGIEYFRFYDDLFTLNKPRVIEFCDEIKRRGLKINFRVLIRAGTDIEILKALKSAGCESVGFGIESGSDRVLQRIHKGITRSQILETLKACRETGLWSVASFIVSLPDETYDDFKDTLSLVGYPDTFMVNALMLFPYTPFYNELKANGEISDDIWFDRKYPNRVFYTKEHFPSASFYSDEIRWLMICLLYYSHIRNPIALLKSHGIFGGTLRFIKALLDIPFKGRLDRLYHRLLSGANS
ncbi:MAG: radical SAM protein [Nitrospirae bacterium]|nr:MAG: radical SAM protein [Nitrospirota bacterium]